MIANPHVVSRLAKHMIADCRFDAPASITAPLEHLDAVRDPDKTLLPQREAYFRQSAATVGGRRPEFSMEGP